MEDKILEKQYLDTAQEYIDTNFSEGHALFLSGVMYALDQREEEVAKLKQRITELGG